MSTFNKSVNILIACLGSVPANVLCKLFAQYCTCYYGIALCDLTSNMFQQLCVLWRKNVRRILRVPQRTHNRLLPLIAEIPCIDISCYSRIVKFYLSLLESDNYLLRCLAKRCAQQSFSNMGKNVSYIHCKTGFLKYIDTHSCTSIIHLVKDILQCATPEDKVLASVCHELLSVRDGVSDAPLTITQANELLSCLTTS